MARLFYSISISLPSAVMLSPSNRATTGQQSKSMSQSKLTLIPPSQLLPALRWADLAEQQLPAGLMGSFCLAGFLVKVPKPRDLVLQQHPGSCVLRGWDLGTSALHRCVVPSLIYA